MPTPTPDAARRAVRAMAEAGYDLVKVDFFEDPAILGAILAEARVQGLPVTGRMARHGVAVTPLLGAIERSMDLSRSAPMDDSVHHRIESGRTARSRTSSSGGPSNGPRPSTGRR